MFSQIINEAIAVEEESQRLSNQARIEANQNENDLLLKTNLMIREAQQRAKELISQRIEQSKNEEEILIKENREKNALLKKTLIDRYSNTIDTAALVAYNIIITTSLPVMEP